MNNNWRIIPELESYAVNEDGIVKALAKTRVNLGNGKQRHYKEHIIKPKYTSKYWYVSLMHNGVKKTYRLHRLVYKAFVGEIPKGMVIDHIDGDRSNNNVDNLRCVTMSTNMQNPNTRYNHSKEVLQINPSTKEVVNRFKNITDAETAMTGKYTPGKQQGHIGSCCRGKKNCFWLLLAIRIINKKKTSMKSLYDISWKCSEPEYRADPALSYSTLAKFERKGRFNALPTLFEKDSSPSLTFGSLVDCLLTGSKEEFDTQFLVAEFPKLSDSIQLIAQTLFAKYGKAVDEADDMFDDAHFYATIEEMPDTVIAEIGKQCNFWANDKYDGLRAKKVREGGISEYYKLLVLADGKEVINQKDMDDAYAAIEALRTSENTAFYFAPNNTETDGIERLYQLKFKGEDPTTHIVYRNMADLIVVDYNNKTIQPVDLKTSSHTEWEFHKSFTEWRYDIQARLYWRNIKQTIEKDEYFKQFTLLPYKFIVVNRITLQPQVWDFHLTQTEGLLRMETIRNGVYLFRDPYTIGEELAYYLANPECKVPREMQKSNNIVDFLTKNI